MANAARPTVVCAWCERMLFRGSDLVSHGICRGCVRAHMPEVYTDLARERRWE